MEGDHLPGLGLGGWGEDGDEEVDEALQNSRVLWSNVSYGGHNA